MYDLILATFTFNTTAIIFQSTMEAVFTNNDFSVLPNVDNPAVFDCLLLYDSTLLPQSIGQIAGYARSLLITTFNSRKFPQGWNKGL